MKIKSRPWCFVSEVDGKCTGTHYMDGELLARCIGCNLLLVKNECEGCKDCSDCK